METIFEKLITDELEDIFDGFEIRRESDGLLFDWKGLHGGVYFDSNKNYVRLLWYRDFSGQSVQEEKFDIADPESFEKLKTFCIRLKEVAHTDALIRRANGLRR